jgi:hypothetical protein
MIIVARHAHDAFHAALSCWRHSCVLAGSLMVKAQAGHSLRARIERARTARNRSSHEGRQRGIMQHTSLNVRRDPT